MSKQIRMAVKLYVFALMVTLCSCGGIGFAVQEHLTDKFYLIAVNTREELGISYHYRESGYTGIVSAKVVAAGYNHNFIIVKQQPIKNSDTTFYYIIDVNEIRKEREIYVPTTYTDRSNITGKDANGNNIYDTWTSNYSPKRPDTLTYETFISKRKELNVPDSLDFTINTEHIINR